MFSRSLLFDNRLVKNTRLLILMISGLFGLLILLGSLQYFWLGEISRSERENLQNRLNIDIKRFAVDFNAEMRWAYYSFQIDPADWLKKDWTMFNRRYDGWKLKTSYPGLIKEIYFVGKDSALLRYDADSQTFKSTELTGDLAKIREIFEQNKKLNAIDALVVNTYFLLMPNYPSGREKSVDKNGVPAIELDLSGYVVIKLDEETVRKILADLTEKHFPEDGFAKYQIVVSDNPDLKQIYSNKDISSDKWEKNDSNISILDLSESNLSIFVNSSVFSAKSPSNRKVETQVKALPPPKMEKDDTVKVQRLDSQNDKTKELPAKGYWTLSVRHEQGALEQFIANTRRKNLGISFGILGLLAVSIVLIFVSARRSQILAQRQMDFVSSVSHEFRTPLAVIYSAGENLADGVTQEKVQVSRYGNLIKTEGRKLSQMVEQILEFAGARSGRRKYNFTETQVAQIIENAVKECELLITEKDFTVEKDIAADLPAIFADKNVLSQAVQNLIINSIKYDDGSRFIKISACQNNGGVNITVEDSGIGIAKGDLSKVFAPFYRAKSIVDAQIHGSGLGLSLVKQSVEAHGGKIKVESEIGRGSRFVIHLPLSI